MAKKKLKRTPEEIARSEEVMRKVQERIDYHTRKLAEERAAKSKQQIRLVPRSLAAELTRKTMAKRKKSPGLSPERAERFERVARALRARLELHQKQLEARQREKRST